MKCTGVALACLPTVGGAAIADEAGVRIIVNASNGIASLTREQAQGMFLKKTKRWGSGADVVVVDQSLSSEIRYQFSSAVLGHQSSWVKQYWTEQIITGRGTPPVIEGSGQDVVAFVAGHEGAVGYVSRTATLPDTVRVLRVEPDAGAP